MKQTIILIVAAMMTLPVSYVSATEARTSTEALQQKKQKAALKEVTFIVHLHCENCVAKVFDNMSRAKGVKDLNISLEKQTVAIKYDASKTSEDALKAAIEKLGYPVNGKAGHDHNHQGHDHGHKH